MVLSLALCLFPALQEPAPQPEPVSQASDRVMAVADGQLLTIGTPGEVQSHPEVLRAYLGD